MERLIDSMLTRHIHDNPILNVILYATDLIGSIMTVAWLTGIIEFFHIYILIVTAISITFTAVVKHNQWRDKRDEKRAKERACTKS